MPASNVTLKADWKRTSPSHPGTTPQPSPETPEPSEKPQPSPETPEPSEKPQPAPETSEPSETPQMSPKQTPEKPLNLQRLKSTVPVSEHSDTVLINGNKGETAQDGSSTDKAKTKSIKKGNQSKAGKSKQGQFTGIGKYLSMLGLLLLILLLIIYILSRRRKKDERA